MLLLNTLADNSCMLLLYALADKSCMLLLNTLADNSCMLLLYALAVSYLAADLGLQPAIHCNEAFSIKKDNAFRRLGEPARLATIAP
jgi:hypothetical protein